MFLQLYLDYKFYEQLYELICHYININRNTEQQFNNKVKTNLLIIKIVRKFLSENKKKTFSKYENQRLTDFRFP